MTSKMIYGSIALMLFCASATVLSCSVTVESGSALRHHGETSEDHAEPTPTPTPAAAANGG